MRIEQIYTGCLAQGAYYIVSNGEAAIIDPLREITPYLQRAERDGVRIRYIFETHFHADFVSGHVDLARATGAPIVYGPGAKTAFDALVAEDGQEFALGNVRIKVLHTPGHTMESSCYLLLDEEGQPHAVFTGDTLFIGDVGRPDLAQRGTGLTQEELAGYLYDSLRRQLMTLPDTVLVYPAHGAGSACGKNMSKETVSTIGIQKQLNYALRADMNKEEFVREVTDGLLPPPGYFPQNVQMNKEGYESIDKVLSRGVRPLEPKTFEALANETGALILDTRKAQEFAQAFIPNSIFVGLDGGFAPWVGALIPDLQQPILLVTDAGREEEAVTRLARVGYDHTIGYLEGGIPAWAEAGFETDSIRSVSAAELEAAMKDEPLIIDVRRPGEFQAGHITGAVNLPLDFINDHLSGFPRDSTFFIHCAGGYRSMIAASILKARGWSDMIDVAGGYGAIARTGISCTESACSDAG